MKNVIFAMFILMLLSCKSNEDGGDLAFAKAESSTSQKEAVAINLNQEFKDYWYSGTAEISSYELSQARYGEMRNGKAVMVFVTEPFDATEQVKADQNAPDNIPVMKLNATRDFNTGIYPYSMMSSTFVPLDQRNNAVKVASSIQEWCGHTYMQFNEAGDSYDVTLHSYFQSEGNRDFTVPNVMLENQIPVQLRIDPLAMPTGEMQVIPSTEYLRLKHIETKAYPATASIRTMEDGYVYSIRYADLNRIIAFKTEKEFPYKILSWMERYNDGGSPMVSTGTHIKTIKSAYWNKNSNADEALRKELGL